MIVDKKKTRFAVCLLIIKFVKMVHKNIKSMISKL